MAKNYSCLVMKSIVKDLRTKGYNVLFFLLKDEARDPNFVPDCKIGINDDGNNHHVASLSINDGYFMIHGNGLHFDNIDICDPTSIDRLYLAIELLTKMVKQHIFVNDQKVDHVERIRRTTMDMEVQAAIMREYYLKEKAIECSTKQFASSRS